MATPERPYHITWRWEAETTKEYKSQPCIGVGDCTPTWDIDIDLFLESIRSQIIAACYDSLQQQAMISGFNFAITSIEPYVEWVITRHKREWYMPQYGLQRITDYAILKCGATVTFDSDVPVDLHEPHFSPLVWWQWVLIAFLGFVFSLYMGSRLWDFLESLVTKKTKTTSYIHYPDCTEETKEEEITEPNWMSMLLLGGLFIVGVAVVAPIVLGRR